MSATPPSVGVVGASARAAAHSLRRAGYAPWAVDLFADRDLRLVAPCARCPLADYPAALPALADQFPPGPLLYTGGLENHPDVVTELARRRLVLGNSPEVLRTAREGAILSGPTAGGFATLYELHGRGTVSATVRWVLKPYRSCGGQGVRLAEPGEVVGPSYFLQEFADGPSMSAQFATLDGVTTLLGITDQLVGEPWLHARPFAYCGNVGPAAAPGPFRDVLARLGSWYATATGLRGVWGLDFILRDGHPYPVEINPRYTAAMEVLEHATGVAVFRNTTPPPAGRDPTPSPSPSRGEGEEVTRPHPLTPSPQRRGGTGEKAVGSGLPPPLPPGEGEGKGVGRDRGRGLGRTAGKAIYYAPHPITFPASGPWDDDLAPPFDPWRLPGYADIPDPGEPVEPGQPVLTFFAAGSTADGCRARLKERAAELDRLFGWEGQS